jgi:hypothetical protein
MMDDEGGVEKLCAPEVLLEVVAKSTTTSFAFPVMELLEGLNLVQDASPSLISLYL